MYKLFCDRCDSLIKDESKDKVTLKLKSHDADDKKYHLCPKCNEALMKFLEGTQSDLVVELEELETASCDEDTTVADSSDVTPNVEDDTPTNSEDISIPTNIEVDKVSTDIVDTTNESEEVKKPHRGKVAFKDTAEGKEFLSKNKFTGKFKDEKGRYTWELIQHIIKLKSEGCSTSAIGHTCGLTYSSCYNIIPTIS